MTSSRPADERGAFAETFLALGPEAPTILPGWDALDLLEHLLLREAAPHLMVGALLPGAVGRRAVAAREQLRTTPWEQLVGRFADGPPPLSPTGRVDALTGQGELLIHHEDLRRAQDGWEPRRLPPEIRADAWRATGLMARAMRVPAEVILVSPHAGRRVGSRRAAGGLRVHGEEIELLLWVTGRDEVARVRIDGDTGGLRALEEGRRGF
ncbi:TIGR03085 family metal-binding protein [Brachybacterium sp. YJGR34]|uniref:TIGR03085 family metal-binding protein n=1 Tax=Brachybacterium sp. YJGR34 TaxID=2059911 RepID=UPI000E0BD968|nr:TIGR03085 family metal-binding protein [Brachybacterium sp. YJGR34]